MGAFLSLWLYSILTASDGSYFLSPNPLTQPKAKQFCRNYCSSDLASIHNETQWNRTIEIIKHSFNISSPPLFVMDSSALNINSYDVWIGLEGGNTWTMQWSDGSSFDYGTSQSVPPWDDNEPSTWSEQCVQVWSDKKYAWNDFDCGFDMRVLCNSCVGKLNKFILIKQAKNNADAQAFCRMNIGTDLASLHSKDDFREAQSLCELTGGQSCWIGLNDIADEGVWKWKGLLCLFFLYLCNCIDFLEKMAQVWILLVIQVAEYIHGVIHLMQSQIILVMVKIVRA